MTDEEAVKTAKAAMMKKYEELLEAYDKRSQIQKVKKDALSKLKKGENLSLGELFVVVYGEDIWNREISATAHELDDVRTCFYALLDQMESSDSS